MFVEERQEQILALLQREGKVMVDQLVERFSVSAPTVRADLTALEQRHLLRRTHGGAIPVTPPTRNSGGAPAQHEPAGSNGHNVEATGAHAASPQQRERLEEKRRIALAAAERVKDGETILLDAGTTVLEMARGLAGRKNLTVVTNSLPAANALAESGHSVVVLGGEYNPERRATLGPLTAEFLRDMHVDRAFIGVNGVSEEAGWTVVDFDAVQVKRVMMSKAREVVVLVDHSKLGSVAFASIGPLNAAQVLITDVPIEQESLQAALEAAGVSVVMSDQMRSLAI